MKIKEACVATREDMAKPVISSLKFDCFAALDKATTTVAKSEWANSVNEILASELVAHMFEGLMAYDKFIATLTTIEHKTQCLPDVPPSTAESIKQARQAMALCALAKAFTQRIGPKETRASVVTKANVRCAALDVKIPPYMADHLACLFPGRKKNERWVAHTRAFFR